MVINSYMEVVHGFDLQKWAFLKHRVIKHDRQILKFSDLQLVKEEKLCLNIWGHQKGMLAVACVTSDGLYSKEQEELSEACPQFSLT